MLRCSIVGWAVSNAPKIDPLKNLEVITCCVDLQEVEAQNTMSAQKRIEGDALYGFGDESVGIKRRQ